MQSKKQESIETRVLRFIRKNRMLATNKKVVVAVSGGQDSVCLLHLLTKLQPELKTRLYVAHLNHQLRGINSTADAQYVLDLCNKIGVPVTIGQEDVKAYKLQTKLSLEEAAREVRYRFLAEVANVNGTDMVAVAHTRNDNVETILLHIIRGTGTRGLRGLQPLADLPHSDKHLKLVRPLLTVSREETGAYCRRHKLNARGDETNYSLEPLRNRVRLKLIPELKEYNSGIEEALLRTSKIAAEDINFLEKTATTQWVKIAKTESNQVNIDKAGLLKLSSSIRRYVLRLAVESLAGSLKDIEGRHIEEMMELLSKPAGKQLSLPYGMRFVNEYDRYIIFKESVPPAVFDEEFNIKILGLTRIPGWKIETKVIPKAKNAMENPFIADLDFVKIGGHLIVRARKPGDRLQPLGMTELKKVGQFMLDTHVPRLSRNRVPLVISDNQVAWIVGWRIDERFKVTDETKTVLRIFFSPNG